MASTIWCATAGTGKDRTRRGIPTGTAFNKPGVMYVSVNVRVAELDLSQVFKISSATLAFLLALQKPGLSRPAFLVFVGSALGVWIYLLHYIIGTVIKDAMLFYNAGDLAINWILPPVVIAASVLVAALLNIVVAKKRSDS